MRNGTSRSWYFMPLSILLSSLPAMDIRDNLFLGLFIEGVECLPCAAVVVLPFGGTASVRRLCWAAFRHRVGADMRVGVLSRKSGNPAVLRPTERTGANRWCVIRFHNNHSYCSPTRREEYSRQNRNFCTHQGKFLHTNHSAIPAVAPHA